jgi:hypothetical protein
MITEEKSKSECLSKIQVRRFSDNVRGKELEIRTNLVKKSLFKKKFREC